MRGIKIPQQDFALKRQGGLCSRGGGVFAGHYGIIKQLLSTVSGCKLTSPTHPV